MNVYLGVRKMTVPSVFTVSLSLTSLHCCILGVIFAVDDLLLIRLRTIFFSFHCKYTFVPEIIVFLFLHRIIY